MNSTFQYGPKSEWRNQALSIARGETKTTASDIPMLLEWLQDMNWPGAGVIAEYLLSFGDDLIPHIRSVLLSADSIWSRWVLLSFAHRFGAEFWCGMHKELQEIAEDQDDAEGANVEALLILALTGMKRTEWICDRLSRIKSAGLLDPGDYVRIDVELDTCK